MSVFAATSDILLPGYRLSNGEEKNKQYNYNDNTGEAVFKVVLVVSKEAQAAKSRIHQYQAKSYTGNKKHWTTSSLNGGRSYGRYKTGRIVA